MYSINVLKSCKTIYNISRNTAPLSSNWALNFGTKEQINLVRYGSTFKFNRNMEFFASDNSALVRKEPKSFELQMPGTGERPLTILLSWLMSKESHVKKFVKIYNDLGFDVLKLRISPFDLLSPKTGSQIVASNMLEFLHANSRHSTVLVHGFSVGAYVFCEGLYKVEKDFDRHGVLMDRFVGQIWDSAVDIYGIPNGVSKAITNNKTLQFYLHKYIEWFIQLQKESRTAYERSSGKFHEGYLNVPSLFYMSKIDPVSPPDMNFLVIDKWTDKGIPVFTKIFDKSAHVSHYYKYKKEYEAELFTYLQFINILEKTKTQARS